VLFRALVIVLAQNTTAIDHSDGNILIESVIIRNIDILFYVIHIDLACKRTTKTVAFNLEEEYQSPPQKSIGESILKKGL